MTDYIVIINIFEKASNDNRLFRESSEYVIRHCTDTEFLETLEDQKRTAISDFCKNNKKYERANCTSSVHQITVRP